MKAVRCRKGHDTEILKCDLSKAYGKDDPYFMVRCAVKDTCCFSDYFPTKLDAVLSWNRAQEQRT